MAGDCGNLGTRSYELRGQVLGVDAKRQEVLLKHDDVPGLMSAMTMPFRAPEELLEGLRAGDLGEDLQRHRLDPAAGARQSRADRCWGPRQLLNERREIMNSEFGIMNSCRNSEFAIPIEPSTGNGRPLDIRSPSRRNPGRDARKNRSSAPS